jgi:hypothetical protein
MGGCGTRAFSTQTVLAAFHPLAQAKGAAKGIKIQNHANAENDALEGAWILACRASISDAS